MKIKTLSLWQPWASLIATGDKRIETRSWATNYRGPLAIHAARRWNRELYSVCLSEPFNACLLEAGYRKGSELPFGAMVAVVDLVNVYQIEVQFIARDLIQSIRGDDAEQCYQEEQFGNYAPGRFGWVLENVRRLQEPIPVRGYQGLWTWDAPDGFLEQWSS